jgi:acylphosphatase
MDDKITLRLTMHGKLQGVGFRRFIKDSCEALGLDGWVRNVSDGTVEALVHGSPQVLASFQSALFTIGYRFRLDTISRSEVQKAPSSGFRQRRTRVVDPNNTISRERFMDMVSDLYERPRAAGLPMDLPQRVTDILDAKAREFYQLRIVRGPSNYRNDYSRDQLARMVENAGIFQINRSTLRHMERNGIAINRAVSFHGLMLMESEERRLGLPVRSWWVDQKLDAYRLADKLNIRYPRNDGNIYTFADIKRPSGPLVIKPVQSTASRGVALFYADDDIRIVRDNVRFTSWESYREHVMTELLHDPQARPSGVKDRWILEELILEDVPNRVPARDLKFFCFYGRVGLILEMTRGDSVNITRWTAEGENVTSDTGMDSDNESWVGDGVTQEQIREIEEISRHIPVPFIRIDMLLGEKGMVLGEMTPRPGQWDRMNRHWDRRLGEEYVRARARLVKDLMEGKRFDLFLSLQQGESSTDIQHPFS